MDARESVKIGGREYQLCDPGHLRVMREARASIISGRPNPLLEAVRALAELPADMAAIERAQAEKLIRSIAEQAMLARNRVTAEDIGLFLQTREGLAFALQQFCPEIKSSEQADELLGELIREIGEALAVQTVQTKLDTASGLVEAKNSSGPSQNSSGL